MQRASVVVGVFNWVRGRGSIGTVRILGITGLWADIPIPHAGPYLPYVHGREDRSARIQSLFLTHMGDEWSANVTQLAVEYFVVFLEK